MSGIDAACSEANDKLRRLAVVLPDAASLSPLDHDTTKRADPEVLHRLIQHAKSLRVSGEGQSSAHTLYSMVCVLRVVLCVDMCSPI